MAEKEQEEIMSSFALENRTRIHYPINWNPPIDFVEKIKVLVKHIEHVFEARPFALYFNNDFNNKNQLHSLKISFDKESQTMTIADVVKIKERRKKIIWQR